MPMTRRVQIHELPKLAETLYLGVLRDTASVSEAWSATLATCHAYLDLTQEHFSLNLETWRLQCGGGKQAKIRSALCRLGKVGKRTMPRQTNVWILSLSRGA